jgi:hypothetical protein
MSLKPKLSVMFLVILISVPLLGVFPFGHSQSSEEPKPQFIFIVSLGQINWETRTIEAPIQIWFENLPDSFKQKDEKGQYVLTKINVEFKQWHNIGQVTIYRDEEASKISFRGSLPENRFHFRGLTELYPYDSYMFDITFTSPSFGIIGENNTITKPEILAGGFNLREDWGSGDMPFILTYESVGGIEDAVVNFKVYLNRSSSSIDMIYQVLIICFFLVGSIPLIKPERLEHRLSICLSLFIFAVTFSFNIPIPALNRATLAESLIFIQLTGAGLFSIVSVIERALFEARPKFTASRFILEGLVILVLANNLRVTLDGMITPNLATEYPWASIPSVLMPLLSTALVFGYATVVLAHFINFMLKKRDLSETGKGLSAVNSLVK